MASFTLTSRTSLHTAAEPFGLRCNGVFSVAVQNNAVVVVVVCAEVQATP